MRACPARPVRTASLLGDTHGMVRNRRPPSRALLGLFLIKVAI
jgi:hypothetical protein